MEHFITEPVLVAIAFVIFIAGVFKPVKLAIIKAIDAQIAEAMVDLEQASKMREEAEAMQKQAKKDLSEAKKLADEMVKNAKSKSSQILRDSKREVEKVTKKKTELSLARISQQERQIIEDLKNNAVSLAIEHVQSALINELDKNAQMALIENSISAAKKIVH